jgi:hypothetical protein
MHSQQNIKLCYIYRHHNLISYDLGNLPESALFSCEIDVLSVVLLGNGRVLDRKFPIFRLLKPEPHSFKTPTTTDTSFLTQLDRQDAGNTLCSSKTSWTKHYCFVDIKSCGSGQNKLKISAAK